MHILRNAVDHGIESPAERHDAHKAPDGRITITVARDREHASITVTDDGRGIDPSLIVKKAFEKGIISSVQAAALSTQEALSLICTPGFSMASEISDISGRGVGMDAVKTTIHGLGGALTITSNLGQGSRFLLKLPITVSIIQAVLVECGRLTLAFPVNTVDRTLEVKSDDLFENTDQTSCILGEETIAIRSLNRLLGQPLPDLNAPRIPVIVSGSGATHTGLTTNRILGQQEIFVKRLGRPLGRLKGSTGGAIMGDGRIVFVMDISTFTS